MTDEIGETVKIIAANPLHMIQEIYEEVDRECFNIDPSDSRAWRELSRMKKIAETKATNVTRSWVIDMVSKTVTDIQKDILTHGFDPSNDRHLSLVVMAMTLSQSELKSMVNGLRNVAEFSGVFKQKETTHIVTAEELSRAASLLMAANNAAAKNIQG